MNPYGTVIQEINMLIWAVHSVVWGVGWVRNLVCVMVAGVVGTWGKCCFVYMRQ